MRRHQKRQVPEDQYLDLNNLDLDKGRAIFDNYDDKAEEKKEQKATSTAFILMFPALILAGMAVYYSGISGAILAIALAIYQFLMLKKFIEDYYKNR